MNIEETLQLLDALKAAGVTSFKSGEHEITLDRSHSRASLDTSLPAHHHVAGSVDSSNVRPSPSQVTPAMSADAARRTQDLIDTLKMKDADLVDKIFPAGS